MHKAYMIGAMNAEYNFKLKKKMEKEGYSIKDYRQKKRFRPAEIYSRKQIDAYELGYRSSYAKMGTKYRSGELVINYDEIIID